MILWDRIKIMFFRLCLFCVRVFRKYCEWRIAKTQSKISKNSQNKAVYERVNVKKKFRKHKNKGKK